MTNIGKKILESRTALGITQEELARRMGYKSKSTINKIELGINDIPQSKVVKFAEVLGVSVAYLMNWEEEKTENPATDDGISEKRQQLIDFAKSVPEDQAELILRVMRTIVGDN